ncbi:MAG: hypothetical protein ACHQ1H_00155 [Nitrososphaerales archaeon]
MAFIPSFAAASPVFSAPINISHDSGVARFPNVANSGNHVYVAWTEGGRGIFFRASANEGDTWQPAISSLAMKISARGGTTQRPWMSANGSDVYVVWAQTPSAGAPLQVYFSASTNFGRSFSTPQIIDTNSSAMSIGPVLCSWGSNVYVAWFNQVSSTAGARGFPLVRTTTDAGASWGVIHKIGATQEPQLACWGGKYVYSADDGAIFVSSDNGVTWKHTAIFHGTEPFLASWGANVYVTYEFQGKASNVSVSISNNFGASFLPPLLLTSTVPRSWGPMIGARGNSAYIAWHNNPGAVNSQIWLTMTSNGGATWSPPRSLSGLGNRVGWPFNVAVSGKSIFIMWGTQLGPRHWSAFATYSGDGGRTWTAPPGIDVSKKPSGTAAMENDAATGSLASFGAHGFAVWQYNTTATNSQVYFSAS